MISEKYAIIVDATIEAAKGLRVKIIIVIALVLGAAVFQALGPLGLRTAVNALAHKDTLNATIGICFYAAVVWLGRAAQARLSHQFGKIWRPIRKNVSVTIYRYVLTADDKHFFGESTGKITQIVSDGLSGVRTTLRSVIFGIIPTAMQFVVVMLIIFFVGHFEFILIVVGFAASYGLIFHWGTHRQVSAQRQAVGSDTRLAGLASDIIMGRESAKLYDIQDTLTQKLSVSLDKSEKHWSDFSNEQHFNQQILNCLFIGILGVALGLAAYRVSYGMMNIGDFVLINVYLFQIVAPIERLSASSREVIQALVRIGNLSSLLRCSDRVVPPPSHGEMLSQGPLSLSVTNLWFGYQPGRPIIRGANFHIERGQSIAIVGQSGSGKSTLWRLICRLYDADKGLIEINGVRASDINLGNFRESISIVQQENTLFNASIRENITLWDQKFSNSEFASIVNVAVLDKLLAKLPQGAETIVGERGYRVSGGERQRIAIARALLRKPRLIIFDEATSALDAETESILIGNISSYLPVATKIIITHKLSIARDCDEILVLEDGSIIERGHHNALLSLHGRYREMWMSQIGGITSMGN